MTVQKPLLFVFGLGYSALALSDRLMANNWAIAGTVRTRDKAEQLRRSGIDAHVWDSGEPDAADPLGQGGIIPPGGAHWLISLPPGQTGCPALAAFRHHVESARSVTYLSTTGVYGDLGGGWAFEYSLTNAQSKRSQARRLAEVQWSTLTAGGARHVRLPGIYGPGRSALDRVKAGRATAIIKPGQVFSRVHVDDIASGLAQLLKRPEARGVFHLCDDEPAPPQDVLQYAAQKLGLPQLTPVNFEDADLSPMARSFYSECKRVSNARTKSALDWQPSFPTYREGLDAILAIPNKQKSVWLTSML